MKGRIYMKKKLLSILLVFVILTGMIPNAFAYNSAKPLPSLTGDQAKDTANIATSQVGYAYNGGTVYGAWWNGVTNWGVDYTCSGWCSMFACWCANKAGAGLNVAYDKNGASPSLLLSWLKSNASADTSFSTAPKVGDFIFFGSGGSAEHVAVVTGYNSSTKVVSFVGGNQGNGVVSASTCQWSSSYNWGGQHPIGYGRPKYGGSTTPTDAKVSTNKSTYQLGETVTVSPSAKYYDYFTIRICYGTYGADTTVFSDFKGFTGTKTYTPDKAGKYVVRVSAYNKTSGKWADAECTFTVQEGKMTVSGVNFPDTVVKGNSVSINGTVSANGDITWVWMGVNSKSVWHVIETSANPNKSSYNLSQLSKKLDFTKLEPGEYTFSIEATGLGQYWNLYKKDFTVVNELQNYTVQFNANGGSGAPAVQTKVQGKVLTLSSTKPTRTGYTFLGWATSSTATSAAYQPGDSYSNDADLTLYAVWKAIPKTYQITYNPNGGSGAPDAQTKTQGQALTLSSTVPTRDGCTFLGWAVSPTATKPAYQPGAAYTKDEATVMYAIWEQIITPPDNFISYDLKAEAAGKNRVKLTWGAVDGAEGYIIYRRIGSGSFSYRYMVPGTTYTDVTASETEWNFYRVYPYFTDANGKRILGNSANYTYAKGVLPMVPGLKAIGRTGYTTVSWNSVPEAEGYIIYRRIGSNGSFSYRYMTKSNVLYFNDVTASKTEWNFYRVYPYYMKDGTRILNQNSDYTYAKAS